MQDFDLIYYISEQEEERIPISSMEPDQVDPDNPDADDPEMRNESSDEEEVIFWFHEFFAMFFISRDFFIYSFFKF